MICVIDGREFESNRSDAKYCSPKCRKQGSRVSTIEGRTFVADGESPIAEITNDLPDWAKDLNESLRAKGLPLVTNEPDITRFIPTGIAEIDALTARDDIEGIGGIPRKKITELAGPKGSSKTTLIKIIAMNNPELKIIFFDAEGGSKDLPSNVFRVKGNVVEEIMPAMIDAVEKQTADLVVLDSVASLVTKKRFDGDAEGKASMARAFGPEIQRLLAHLQPLKDGLPDPCLGVAALFINQFRSTTNSFGLMEYTVGGKALEYYSSLRLTFRSNKSSLKVKDGIPVGQKVEVTVTKNRFGPPQETTSWYLDYDIFKRENQ